VPRAALAQPESIAAALFRQARQSMKVDDWKVACPKLEESQRLDPSPGTLLNLAICEERRGRLATAWTRYQELVDTTSIDDPRAALARRAVATLDHQLSRVRIVVGRMASGSIVNLDSTQLRRPSLGTYLPIDPGEHVITVMTPEGVRRDRHFTIQAGETVVFDLAPISQQPAPRAQVAANNPGEPVAQRGSVVGPRTPHATFGNRRLRTASFAAASVGIIGFVAAGTFALLAVHEKRIVDEHCPAQRCDADGVRAVDAGNRLLRLGDAGLVVGVAGAAAAAVLYWQSAIGTVRLGAGPAGAALLVRASF
jgi:hypothetical protein